MIQFPTTGRLPETRRSARVLDMEEARLRPPLAVELSRPVLLACRRDPELGRAINGILLRAARRLRSMIEPERRVRVAGEVEAIVIDLHLLPPDGCLVEAVHRQGADRTADLTV